MTSHYNVYKHSGLNLEVVAQSKIEGYNKLTNSLVEMGVGAEIMPSELVKIGTFKT